MNKNLIIGLAVLVLVLIGGGIYLLSSKKAVPRENVPQTQEENQVMILTPEDIGLTLTSAASNKKIIMEIAKTADISSVDYELSYTSKGDIPRGVIGYIDVKVAGKPVKQEITLGTCSDVCHYDEGVSKVNLVLKITKMDNKIYQVEKSLDL